MRTPEGTVKDAIKAVLDEYGDELYQMWPVQMGYGKRVLDCYVCFRGLFIVVETKRSGERARKLQEKTLDEVRNASGHALCVDGPDELRELLSYIARHRVKLVERNVV